MLEICGAKNGRQLNESLPLKPVCQFHREKKGTKREREAKEKEERKKKKERKEN